jgi:hypothetical protein
MVPTIYRYGGDSKREKNPEFFRPPNTRRHRR